MFVDLAKCWQDHIREQLAEAEDFVASSGQGGRRPGLRV